MLPLGVSTVATGSWRGGHGWIAVEPFANRVVIELLRPYQAGVRLPSHASLIIGDRPGNPAVIERVRLGNSQCEHFGRLPRLGAVPLLLFDGRSTQSQADDHFIASWDLELVMPSGLR